MNALKAAELAREAREAGLNSYVNKLLKDIEVAARNGENHIDMYGWLHDDTINCLTGLGYKVSLPGKSIVAMPIIISW